MEWDGGRYDESFSFVPRYGQDVLSLLPEGHGGRAVDLGCGTGALTGAIAVRGYRVMGIDPSEGMLARAREKNPGTEFVKGDARTFSLCEKADAVFSNAVFHWIREEDQDALAANIASQTREGGVLVTEFGGKGCAAAVHAALSESFAAHGLSYRNPFFFPTVGEYARILERHGFLVRYACLFDRPTPLPAGQTPADWVSMFVREPFAGVDGTTEAEILRETDRRLEGTLLAGGRWHIDYVRIRVKAERV